MAGPAAGADPAPLALGSRFAARLVQAWGLSKPNRLARALQPLSWLYGALVALRHSAYRHGWLATHRAPVPVLVVGNLVAGGAGKTPTVLALLPRLRALGFTPGVVSRGHGRQQPARVCCVRNASSATEVGDEPLLIHIRGRVPVAVGADRLAAAQALCREHPEVDLLVADDGLQHLRLARDAELLVFDDRGAGNGLLLPAGPLRQPMPRRLPASSAVLYSVPKASTALAGSTGQRRLRGVLPLADWLQGLSAHSADPAHSAHSAHSSPPDPAQATDPWAALRGRPVLAAAGLARPEAFFSMLEQLGLQIERLPLPDHARFEPLPWPADTADVVVTEKDAVKLGVAAPPAPAVPPPTAPSPRQATRIWVATLDFEPEPAFDDALRRLCLHFRPATAPPNKPKP